VRRRILIVGATGAFGARLARLLASWEDVDLVLAARRDEPLRRLADELRPQARAQVSMVIFDRTRPEALAALAPWALVDAAGPFQTSDLRLPRAAIAAGAHYVDIADARRFAAEFSPLLDAEARLAGVLALTGASSTPALSNAAADEITRGWRDVERLGVAICPGARAPRGLSVVRAILSYVGRPVRVFANGGWSTRPGWSGPHRVVIPTLGRRWVSVCETPDLDVLPARFAPSHEALFFAGLELGIAHLGLWALSWLVRFKLARDLSPLARALRAAAGIVECFGSDRGGMLVWAEGRAARGARVRGCWSLVAEANAGPTVPIAAAAAALRGLKDGRLDTRGAHVCAGLLRVDDILFELQGLPISSRLERGAPADGLFRRVMGDAFANLPAAVAKVHDGSGALKGRARARGSRAWPVRLLRRLMGVPPPGVYPDVSVRIAEQPAGETWSRRFGDHRFASQLRPLGDSRHFEERFGLLRFTFSAEPTRSGFRWTFLRWRLGALPMPSALAPRIRARAFERDGGYRFRVLTAHPLFGVLFAYAGRLE
jgi:NAD(P)-dependent dehydrogenase (short-subunit alcohol dehydrogenase family)